MQPDDIALVARVAQELVDVLGLIRNGVDDASLSAKGARQTQEMLAEQARTIERVVDSLRRRTEDLLGLQRQLEAAGAAEAAAAVEQMASEFRSGFSTAAGPMRRWVLANDAAAEAMKIARAKMNAAMNAVLEAADVARLLVDVIEQRPSAHTSAPQ